VVDQYLSTLFENLLLNEQDFLENLATPFVLHPLQELTNVQVLGKQARKVQAEGSQNGEQLEMALYGFA